MKFIILLLSLFIAACSSFDKKDSKLVLRILHTNDHHGHYLADKHGQAGMAARKTLVNKLRTDIKEQGGYSLLLSGGDINTGTMESDIFDAEPDFKGMKKIGYDAMAVGNHEFDNSYQTIKRQQQWAGFPFLSANIFWKKTNKPVFNPLYLVKEFNGVKVGIFGLTTKDTPFKASHDDAKKKFIFAPIIESAKSVVKILKEKEKVDLIVVVTHVGHNRSLTSNGDIALAKAVDGIDVIVGGHSQEIINAEVHNNTVIVQALDWGKYLGVLDLYIDKQNKKAHHEYALRPVNLKKKVHGKRVFIASEIKADSKLKSFFKPFKKKAEKIGKKVVGRIDRTLSGDRRKVRSSQTALAQFMGEAIREQVKGIDAAIINGGAIRASLEKGKVSRKDLHDVHPYGNTIATVELSAQELFDYIKHVAKEHLLKEKADAGGYPHLIGMKLNFKNKELVKIEGLNANWKIEMLGGELKSNKRKFVFSTMNFTAKGGDNYPKLIDKPSYVDTGFMINAAMMNLMEKKKVLKTNKYHKHLKDLITFQ